MDPKRKKLYIALAVVNGAAIIMAAVLAAVFVSVTGRLSSQQAAERWSSKERYSQLSVFYDKAAGMDLDSIYTMRVQIENKLTENSISQENPMGRLWIDAYSAQDTLTVQSPREDYSVSADVIVTATGGDYFLFHPLKLLSGSYYSDDDLMQDRVVIDYNLAWQLFGSKDADGMTVIINGSRYYVAGVVEPDGDKASEYVYGTKPHIYMSYEALQRIYSGADVPVTVYEVCLPDPVTGLAAKIMGEVNTVDDTQSEIMENSARYDILRLYKIAFDGGRRAVVDNSIVYPFWENAARITEENTAVLLVWISAASLVPILTALYFIGALIHRRKRIWTFFKEKFMGLFDKLSIFLHRRKSKTRS